VHCEVANLPLRTKTVLEVVLHVIKQHVSETMVVSHIPAKIFISTLGFLALTIHVMHQFPETQWQKLSTKKELYASCPARTTSQQ
jgi:hypothetical protein